ncbi:MAG: hypothetical protein ACTSRI_17880 [Promethearchaeota archaeon]
MWSKYLQLAKKIILLDLVLSFFIVMSYFWLKNVLIGVFFIFFIACAFSWLTSLIISIVLYWYSKKELSKKENKR